MIRTAIVGAGGYTGAELIDILLSHPQAEIVGVFGSASRSETQPQSIAEIAPRFRDRLDLPVLPASPDAIAATMPDAVFLATPHEASLHLAPAMLERGTCVLDLSAAFRLKDAALYPRYYGFVHTQPVLLARAVYGLVELARDDIARTDLIAVPGCYPTSAILPLAPLVRAGAVRGGTRPIIDSTSGISGAGRSPTLRAMFCEVSQQPYGVFTHRHGPEINAYAGSPVIFTPHLGPYDRGILSTIHVELADGWNESRVRETFAATYADELFIRRLPHGAWPTVGDVRGTNYCDIALAVDESAKHLILVSAIDNLVKGASGQAVQCMNVRFGVLETLGLRGGGNAATTAMRP